MIIIISVASERGGGGPAGRWSLPVEGTEGTDHLKTKSLFGFFSSALKNPPSKNPALLFFSKDGAEQKKTPESVGKTDRGIADSDQNKQI
ncbi:hypothetical protein NHX12_004014 [Muraenolepis orangiensis]|uniref:Uncharacterized protein n=1 Tax=Muraenolepis orangiensis TaxID=630683 RepID=A0A9Q0DY75_9TELE|nr:hypothetical protein NHX12_004014 [Muraenolepis orangiensis]